MTVSEKLAQAIAQLQAVVSDVESAEKGKLKPSVRARKELLTVSKSLNGLRKELLEVAKAEKEKRKAEKEANPKKRYATGFAIKKAKA
jgi:hypothetical protein